MQDFNSYSKNNNKTINEQQNLLNLVSKLAKQYDGKSKNELYRAIYEEAKKGKEQGTLTNSDIDKFVNMLTPFIDDKMKKTLYKVVEEIKKI